MIVSYEILKGPMNFFGLDTFLNYRSSKYMSSTVNMFKEILRRDIFIQGLGTYTGNIVVGIPRSRLDLAVIPPSQNG